MFALETEGQTVIAQENLHASHVSAATSVCSGGQLVVNTEEAFASSPSFVWVASCPLAGSDDLELLSERSTYHTSERN